MSEWQNKSDLEINKAIYNKKYGEPKSEFDNFFSAVPRPNYCNNPSDAWSIIIGSEIGINKLKCEPLWLASDNSGVYERDKNPLRAAMIVYLEMNGVKP